MGIYIEIKDDQGLVIESGKYGVGYSTLMFTDITHEGKSVLLRVSGKEGIDNLNRNIKYLKDNRTSENATDVDYIKSALVYTRNKLRPERTYTCDFSEYFMGSNNPEYSYFNLIEEWYDRMNDVIAGYHVYPKFPRNDFVELAFRLALKVALDCKYGVSLEESNDTNLIYRVQINLSEGEKEIIRKKPIWKDGDEDGTYTTAFARRKIFHAVRSEIGFVPNSILSVGDTTFFVIFNRKDIDEWDKENPYIMCSYRTASTYDIEYLLKNSPEEKEKFYCYATGQNAISIKIDGIEYCGLDDEEVSELLGKKLFRYEYEHNDIVMCPAR